MSVLKKYWPSIVTAIVAVVGGLAPSVQAVASAHPQYSAAILAVWGVILHHLPSPKQ